MTIMAEKELVNKIAQSGLITFDLEELLKKTQWELLDIKPFLVKEMVLMEKPFREALKDFDWEKFSGQWVGLHCSADAIIPHWGYMLLTTYLNEAGANAFFATGEKQEDQKLLIKERIHNLDIEQYKDQRVILKGCGELSLDASFYIAASQKFVPHVKTLMYGEPCSTVPVFKQKKKTT